MTAHKIRAFVVIVLPHASRHVWRRAIVRLRRPADRAYHVVEGPLTAHRSVWLWFVVDTLSRRMLHH